MLLSDVAAELNVSDSQVYHMVRKGELPAIKIGGRGQWRVERAKLEQYIEQKCFISAYDAETGKQLWRFNTVAKDGEPGGNTWGSLSSLFRAGGERDEKHSHVDPIRSSRSHATDGDTPSEMR